MKRIRFAKGQAPNIIAGMMRIAEKTDEEIRELYSSAREHGVDFFDHADIYGGDHLCERRFAEALNLSANERAEVIIQTKCGIVRGSHFDFSYEHIMRQIDGSLRALDTDYIDVLLLHRPDALVEPEEVARAFDELESSGKVRAFGVSNHTPRQIDLLKTAVRQPLVANQVQLSVAHAPIIAQGIAANMQDDPQSTVTDGGGLIEYSRINKMTLQAWSPFQVPAWGGVLIDHPDYPELNDLLRSLAAAYDVTVTAIVTAWITRHPAQMQVVLGTTSPERLGDAAAGSDIPLTRAEWYELFRAGGYRVP